MKVEQTSMKEKIKKLANGEYEITSVSVVKLDSQALLSTLDRAKKEIEQAEQDKVTADKAIETRTKYIKDNEKLFEHAKKIEETRYCSSCGKDLVAEPKKRYRNEQICKKCKTKSDVV